MKIRIISLIVGLGALVGLAELRAVTLAENVAGPVLNEGGDGYIGQSFTTAAGSAASNIVINLFSDVLATTPHALGTAFPLSAEYTRTPEGLNGLDAGEGLLGEATASGGFYTFAASVTLLPGVLFVAARTTEMS